MLNISITLSDLHRLITEALISEGICEAGDGDAWETAKRVCDNLKIRSEFHRGSSEPENPRIIWERACDEQSALMISVNRTLSKIAELRVCYNPIAHIKS